VFANFEFLTSCFVPMVLEQCSAICTEGTERGVHTSPPQSAVTQPNKEGCDNN